MFAEGSSTFAMVYPLKYFQNFMYFTRGSSSNYLKVTNSRQSPMSKFGHRHPQTPYMSLNIGCQPLNKMPLHRMLERPVLDNLHSRSLPSAAPYEHHCWSLLVYAPTTLWL
jgi:hypothetical protein